MRYPLSKQSIRHGPVADTLPALLLVGLGLTVIFGWMIHAPALVQISEGYVYMAFNTALCFTLAGISLIVPASMPARRETGQAIAGFVLTVMGGLVLSQDLAGKDWGIDQFFMNQSWMTNLSDTPGRMAPQTSFCFVLCGLSLFFLNARPTRGVHILLPVITVMVMAIALLSLIGYWLNLEVMYSWYRYTRMAVHTAVGFTLLGLLLWLRWYRMASGTIFKHREDRRISVIGATALILITLASGMSGFVLLAKQMENSLKSSFELILQNQYDLLNFVLTEEIGNAHAMSSYVLLNRLIGDLNQHPGNAEALHTVETVVKSVMARNYSGIAIYGLSGDAMVTSGKFAMHPDIVIPLGGQDTLLWDDGAVLRSTVNLYSMGAQVGHAVVERPLRAITGLVLGNKHIGDSDEVVVCADVGGGAMNCLPTRGHSTVFDHQPRWVGGKPLPMDYVLRGDQNMHNAQDYKGNAVIAGGRLLEPFALGVIMKINASELYEPVREKFGNILLLIALLVSAGLVALRSKLVPLVRQLLKTERLQRAILDSSLYAIITADTQGVITTMNRAAEAMVGYEAAELCGKRTVAVLHSEQDMRAYAGEADSGPGTPLNYFQSLNEKAARNGSEERECIYIHKDGTLFPVLLNVTPMYDEQGGITGYLGMVKDIREQKKVEMERARAEAKLRLSEERLYIAASGTSDGLWDWDIDSGYLYYSPRFKEILGYEDNELANHIDNFLPLLHEEDTPLMTAALEEHFSATKPYDIDYRLLHKDGTYRWINSRGKASFRMGRAVRMTGFVTDITQRKEVDRIKSEFISTVSHELRTPLTSIRGSLGLLLGGVGGGMGDKMRSLVDIAYKNCERLILLINDILDLEKLASGEMRYDLHPQGIKELVLQALELNRAYGEKFGVHFAVRGELADAQVQVDSNRLMQVMGNLLSNAAKFSPANGTVEVYTELQGDTVRVLVSDRGTGIPPEFHARIFQKFAQADSSDSRQKGGTGLGLSISKSIIEHFGGHIGFESGPGPGTVFYFSLPLLPRALPTMGAAGPGRILICEDDADIAALLKAMLKEQRLEADIAPTGAEALRLLALHNYAALTLDLVLPDRDGIAMIQEIRAAQWGRVLPIIVVSARAEEGQKELNGRAIGIVDWLTKPMDTERLAAAIARIPHVSGKPMVLHIEDDDDVAQVIAYELQDIAQTFHVSSLADARAWLDGGGAPDLVLLDLGLPDGSGLDLLPRLSGAAAIPVIIFSASDVSQEISGQVSAALVKSRGSEADIAATIKSMLRPQAAPAQP